MFLHNLVEQSMEPTRLLPSVPDLCVSKGEPFVDVHSLRTTYTERDLQHAMPLVTKSPRELLVPIRYKYQNIQSKECVFVQRQGSRL